MGSKKKHKKQRNQQKPQFDDWHADQVEQVKRAVKESGRIMRKTEVDHIDDIAGAESKCITCRHYCKDGAKAQITTVTSGDTPWYVGKNYCTLLGFFPLKKRFPVSLNSPIGPDGHVLESPEVTKCSEYQKGSFMKLLPSMQIDTFELGMSQAEETLLTKERAYVNQQLIKSTGIPRERFSNIPPEIKKTVEVPLEFGYDKSAVLPTNTDTIIEIACGPLKFKEDVDFTRSDLIVTWLNPAFMVGPHTLLTVKHTLKK
jgi:hypothetical protein